MSGDRAIVRVSIAPVRDEPSHRAARITDWVLGEVVQLGDRDGEWVRTIGPDGYRGWTPAAPFEPAGPMAPDEWEATATLYSLGTSVAHGSLDRLPWGARVVPIPGGVLLPDGEAVSPDLTQRLIRLPDADALSPFDRIDRARTGALDWIGVPYVWGGRTELGVDCSGFVQAVLASCGVRLPRDSREQAAFGPDTGGRTEPGDLIFFAHEGPGISHVALSLGGDKIIHAASANGRVAIDDLSGHAPLERELAASIVARTRPLGETGG